MWCATGSVWIMDKNQLKKQTNLHNCPLINLYPN